MKNISKIALWAGLVIGVVITLVYFMGGWEMVPDSTGKEVSSPVQMDLMLYWMYAVIIIGVVLLLIFACKTLATMFQTDPKGAIKSIVTVALFFVLMAVCYFMSSETEFTRIVNGETEVYSETTMKVIDMWLYSFYALIGITVLLVVGFAAKRLISK